VNVPAASDIPALGSEDNGPGGGSSAPRDLGPTWLSATCPFCDAVSWFKRTGRKIDCGVWKPLFRGCSHAVALVCPLDPENPAKPSIVWAPDTPEKERKRKPKPNP